jgi:putative nucleotidyltransferase with HDIG domain
MTLTQQPPGGRRPPRLVVRTLVATFGAIGLVLTATFLILAVETRARVTREVAANLDASQRAFADLERRRQVEERLHAAALAESPTLKAALDTYQSEQHRPDAGDSAELLATVQEEADRVSAHALADAVIVADRNGRVIASGGPRHLAWKAGDTIPGGDPARDEVIERSSGTFRLVAAPLQSAGENVGQLLLATAVDDGFARELAAVSHAQTAVILNGRVIASTLDPTHRAALNLVARQLPERGEVTLDGERHAVQLLFRSARASVYAVDSVSAAASEASRSASAALMAIALGALGLSGIVSFWLARNVAQPIDTLVQQLRQVAEARDFSQRLPGSGTSLEVNALTDTFNQLMGSLAAAEQATEAAYLAAIKGLAAALDARDPYTAGHSERVSALAVMIGRELTLPERDIEILRLGALLHDIGKIGIRDKVLAKVGPLTADEFEIIKTHPSLGAHILRQVPFLSAHIPIVELHHEQPDGRGYPHGLLGHATPLLARIVHVADAFDAMTSARAYRTAQGEAHALGELRRYRDTQFDGDVVDAFLAAWHKEGTPEVASIQASVRAVPSAFAREAGRSR